MIKRSENVKNWLREGKLVAEEFRISDQALWDQLDFYSPNFKETFIQTERSLSWLFLVYDADKKDEKALLGRLTTVSILLFVCRDHLVFQLLYDSGLYKRIMEKKPLHRLPTVVQVLAIVKALRPEWGELSRDEQEALDKIEGLTDEVLKIETLRGFRDQVVSTGVLFSPPDESGIFPVQRFNISGLVKEAGHFWSVLSEVLAS